MPIKIGLNARTPTCSRDSLRPQFEKVSKNFHLGGRDDDCSQIVGDILLGFLSYENHFSLISNHHTALMIMILRSRLTQQAARN
jgi:hypothetical protein